jgi:uncharacterized protein YndB with AHSA1/START domain
MFKKIGLAFVAVIGLFLVYVALQPSDVTITRELLINASSETIFPYINNSEKANQWMPWKESDPKVVMTFSGPSEGVGSKSSWTSDGEMGHGEAVVTESLPFQSVKTQLTYTKPMDMKQLAEITLTPETGGTLVRWSVSGKNTFIGRIFCVFMDMDKMVGAQFEKGLNTLKKTVEPDHN